jgi:ParB family chromosome partitioning protein
MSMKDRLAAKAANIGNSPRSPSSKDPGEVRTPKTAPGQLMSSLPFLAEKEREIEELQAKLEDAEKRAPHAELLLSELHEVEGRRRRLTAQQYAELRENLRNNRLVQAITVRNRAQGGYEIVSGHNRVAIYRELGRDRILAIVLDDADDFITEASALYANLFQSDLSDYEKYLGFKRLLGLTGKTQKETAADSGATEQSISRWLTFGNLPQGALDLIEKAPDKIGGTAAMALAALAKEGKEEAVIEAVRAIVEGRVSQEAGVRLAKAGKSVVVTSPRPEPVAIRSGKTVYCKMLGMKQTLRLDFRSEAERKEVEAAIKDVLDRFANAVK